MSEIDINQVSKFLIENNYTLSALELLCEVYEKTGTELQNLSDFFAESANFLMFQDMKSVSQMTSSFNDLSSSSEILKMKDDRIAILEHDNQVLHENLKEAESKLLERRGSMSLTPIKLTPDFSAEMTEEEIATLDNLILSYLHNRGYKLSETAFMNDAASTCESPTEKSNPTIDVPLVQLLRSFLFLKSGPLADRLQALQNLHEKDQDTIHQMQQKIDAMSQSQISNPNPPSSNRFNTIFSPKVTRSSTIISNSNVNDGLNSPQIFIPKIPDMSVFDNVLISANSLLEIIKGDDREALVPMLAAVAEVHPEANSRREAISNLLSLWSDPTDDQTAAVLTAVTGACHDSQTVEDDAIPAIVSIIPNSSFSQKEKIGITPNLTKLLSHAIVAFAPLCSAKMRIGLFGIVSKLSESEDPSVRVVVCEDCSTLLNSLYDESEGSASCLSAVLPISRNLLFDHEESVSSTAATSLLPSIQKYVQIHHSGPFFVDFWMRQAFALENIPLESTIELVNSGSINKSNDKFVDLFEKDNYVISKDDDVGRLYVQSVEVIISGLATVESDWLISSFVTQLPKLAPVLFRGNVLARKVTDRLVAAAAGRACVQAASETVLSIFLIKVEEGDKQVLTLLLSAVAPVCETDTFCSQVRNFITYAINGLKGFEESDISSYIIPAFGLLAARDPGKRPNLFKLLSDLTKSSQPSLRNVVISGINEIISALEDNEIKGKVLPILSVLVKDQDEITKKKAIGTLIRFLTFFRSNDQIIEVIHQVFKELEKTNLLFVLQAINSQITDSTSIEIANSLHSLFSVLISENDQLEDQTLIDLKNEINQKLQQIISVSTSNL